MTCANVITKRENVIMVVLLFLMIVFFAFWFGAAYALNDKDKELQKQIDEMGYIHVKQKTYAVHEVDVSLKKTADEIKLIE